MDYIESLPVDNHPLKPEESVLIDTILKTDGSAFQRILNELKTPLVSGILFLVLNSSPIEALLKDTIPYARSSDASLLCLKTIVFILLLFAFNNVCYALK